MGVSKIFLLFILIVSASTKNVVLIGDSRTVGIAVYLMGFDYTTKTAYYGNGSNIVGLTPRIYGSYSVKAVCETGASYNTFTSKAILSSGVHSALAGSSAGTIVLMWLGVNGLNSEGTFNYYKNGLKPRYQRTPVPEHVREHPRQHLLRCAKDEEERIVPGLCPRQLPSSKAAAAHRRVVQPR